MEVGLSHISPVLKDRYYLTYAADKGSLLSCQHSNQMENLSFLKAKTQNLLVAIWAFGIPTF